MLDLHLGMQATLEETPELPVAKFYMNLAREKGAVQVLLLDCEGERWLAV